MTNNQETTTMTPVRLNALTDGVIAIILTIIVLELKVPAEPTARAVVAVLPLIGAYLLSFLYIAIYWNNHHHMLNSAARVTGSVLWANFALLFWLSLIPLLIRWIDEAGITSWPIAAFGVVLACSAFCYRLLERALIAAEGASSNVRRAVETGRKEWVSVTFYAIAVPAAFLNPLISIASYVIVAVTWVVPDRRFLRFD